MQRISLFPLIAAFMLTACEGPGRPNLSTDDLQQGDLLFVATAQSDLEKAIASSTTETDSLQISHVAIACQQGGDWYALEAFPETGVRLNPIEDFLEDNTRAADSRVLLGRLRDTLGIDASVKLALDFLQRPYDEYYMPGDSAIYCSELVQLSYFRPDGTPIFSCQPMSFHDQTGEILPYWEKHYSEAGIQVPEGEPGTNPAAMSKDSAIKLMGFLVY